MVELTIEDYGKIFINGELAVEVDDPNESPTGESGGQRAVFITSKYVFKRGNIGEAFVEIQKRDRKHFALVVLVDIHQRWLVQKRVDCEPLMCTKEQYAVVEKMCHKYGIEDVSWTKGFWGGDGIPERNTHNWIVNKKGIPVIFDYEENLCGY